MLCIASLLLYAYAVNAAVRNTVARGALETQVGTLTTHLSEMEFTYINEKNKVDLGLAIERGFTEVTHPTYISRTAGRSLSFNTLSR